MTTTSNPFMLSRRGALTSGAGLTFAFALGIDTAESQSAAGRLNAYVTIASDGTITIQAPVPEMGQATNTALPLIIAEELDADWSKVKVVTAPVATAYDHPVFKSQFVVASLSTRAYWMPLRTAGAQARRVLLDAVAAKWNVPVGQLTTEPGQVVHAASKRKISYGEVAKFATVPTPLPDIKPEQLKPVANFRLIGKDVARHDIRAKSTGQATYAIDMQLPGMVYATLARAPVMGATAKSHNGDEIKKRTGIAAVEILPGGVAIAGDRIERVLEARKALKVEWNAVRGSSYESDAGLQKYLADVRDLSKKGVVGRKTGEPEPVFATAAKTVSGEYTTDYTYHAQMEPLTAVASVTAEGCEIWAGTQWPSRCRDDAAKLLGIAPEKVKVNMLQMGGGYGRRAHIEYAIEAVDLSKRIGKPVKLMATREDDVANASMRPMTAHKIDVALDAAGKIQAWRHRLAADHVVLQVYGQGRLDAQKGVDHIVMAHADVPIYDVPAHLAEHIYQDNVVRTGAWRGIGAGPNAFAIEAMIDDLAKAAGQDPVAYRLALLKAPRAKAALEKVVAMSEWSRKRDGAALGIAISRLGVPQLGEAMAATVVEASLDRGTGKIKVGKVWCAADVGLPIQPRNIRHQVEGSLIWGLSSALTERITIKNGAVEQTNYSDYNVMRMSDLPEIKIEIIRSGDIPMPVGELGLGTVIPAVSNAVFALTGKRLANAPFTRARVRAAMA